MKIDTKKFYSWFDRTQYRVRVSMLADDGYLLASGDSDVYPSHVGDCVAAAQAMDRCKQDFDHAPGTLWVCR